MGKIEEYKGDLSELLSSKTEEEVSDKLLKIIKSYGVDVYKNDIISNPYFKLIASELKEIVISELKEINSRLKSELNSIKEELKNISKEIQAKPAEYGNPVINSLITSLKEFNGLLSLDGSQNENRRFAYLLIEHKIKPEFKNRMGRSPSDEEIKASFIAILKNADDFNQKHLTNIKYIYYHFGKLIKQEVPRIVDLDALCQ